MTSSKCPYLGSSPVPFKNIPITSAAQKDLLQSGKLVRCVVTLPSMLCRTSSLIAIHCWHCSRPQGRHRFPWEQGKNMAWNRLVWIKLIPSHIPFHLHVENPLGPWQTRIVPPSLAYMGHFKINQQGSISWKEKEIFQNVSLQTDLLPQSSAYFKKCFSLFGAVY